MELHSVSPECITGPKEAPFENVWQKSFAVTHWVPVLMS
jgi:hypothetical protein